MRVPLQQWYDEWLVQHRTPLTTLSHASPPEPRLTQVHFIRDRLAARVWRGTRYDDVPNHPPPRNDCKAISWVVGEHTSKSVRLPVFEIVGPPTLAADLRIILRYNFHDWNVSVISSRPLTLNPRDLSTDYLFFQGFPDECQFSSIVENPRQFSFDVSNDYDLYVLVVKMIEELQ